MSVMYLASQGQRYVRLFGKQLEAVAVYDVSFQNHLRLQIYVVSDYRSGLLIVTIHVRTQDK